MKMELLVLFSFPILQSFCLSLRPIPAMRLIVASLVFPRFSSIWAVLGGHNADLEPKFIPNCFQGRVSNFHAIPRNLGKCLKKAKSWDAVDLGTYPKSESSRKWLGEGAKGLLDPASKRPLALVRNGVAPVQKRVWVAQKTLGRPLLPGPKRVKKTFCTLP